MEPGALGNDVGVPAGELVEGTGAVVGVSAEPGAGAGNEGAVAEEGCADVGEGGVEGVWMGAEEGVLEGGGEAGAVDRGDGEGEGGRTAGAGAAAAAVTVTASFMPAEQCPTTEHK